MEDRDGSIEGTSDEDSDEVIIGDSDGSKVGCVEG